MRRRLAMAGLAGMIVMAGAVGAAVWQAVPAPAEPIRLVAQEAPAPRLPDAVDYRPPAGLESPASLESPAGLESPVQEPVAEPARIVIPAIGVDTEVVSVGLLADGAMEVPDFGLAGWYSLGPRPGQPGPAVIAAHVDSRSGPDVFFRLRELVAGDRIEIVLADGDSRSFVVSHSESERKENLPIDRIWNTTHEPVLRLVTCGGEFDRARRSYRSNTIVYADPA